MKQVLQPPRPISVNTGVESRPLTVCPAKYFHHVINIDRPRGRSSRDAVHGQVFLRWCDIRRWDRQMMADDRQRPFRRPTEMGHPPGATTTASCRYACAMVTFEHAGFLQ